MRMKARPPAPPQAAAPAGPDRARARRGAGAPRAPAAVGRARAAAGQPRRHLLLGVRHAQRADEELLPQLRQPARRAPRRLRSSATSASAGGSATSAAARPRRRSLPAHAPAPPAAGAGGSAKRAGVGTINSAAHLGRKFFQVVAILGALGIAVVAIGPWRTEAKDKVRAGSTTRAAWCSRTTRR